MTNPLPEPEPGAGPVKTADTGRKALRRFLLIATALLLVTAGAGLYFFIAGRDVRDIRSVVDGFVTAVDTADEAGVISLLCQEEAAGLARDENAPPGPPSPSPSSSAAPDDPAFVREITDVEVRDDAASARVVRPDEEPYTLYLREEADAWKVCAPVEERFTGAPPS